MSSKAPTQTVKATSVIKKKTTEEQLLEALEQARAEGAEAAELASVDTSNLLAQAPAATATDAAVSSSASTSTAGASAATSTAAGTTAAGATAAGAAISTGVVVAGVAGVAVVAAASNSSSSSNDTPKDTTAPTATITLSDSALKKGETATVTVTFSEAVTGFSNADLTLTSGELSDMSSSDGGKTWTGTFTPTDDLEDATNVISLANTYTDLAGNAGTTASSANYAVDTKTPLIQSLSANGVDKTVTLTYSETLDATNIPATTAFTIQVNGADNAVTQVVANGATLVLTLANPFITGQTVSVTYTDAVGDGSTTIQDAAGNDAVSFSSGIVADGYIRDAQIYIDTNNNGVADSSEKLEGVVTDANGNFFLPSTAPSGTIIAVGGVNIDTGLPNTTPMKAPAGSTTINPLTTLVQAVVEQAAASGQTLSATEAASNVATALGLTLPVGKTLNNYDPLSATDGGAVAAQKAAAQIATLTTLAAEAAGSSGAQTAATSVLTNIANVVANNVAVAGNTEKVSLADTSVLTQALSGVTLNEAQQAAVVEANTAIAAATNITAISTAQSQFVDKIAPDAPTAISIAALTNDTTPAVEVTLNTKTTDGKAAVAGDTLVIFDGTTEVANVTVTAAHLAAGKVAIDLPTLSEGSHTLTAKLTDKAGNASGISNASTVVVDTTGPSVVISSSTDNLAAGASTTLTMTFSEAVTGLTATDLQVTGGGTINNLVKVSDTVYTATYTAPTTGGAGMVYIAADSYTDAAGNLGKGSNEVNLAAINPPVVTINSIGGNDKVISAQTGDNVISGTAQNNMGNVTVKFGDTVLGLAEVANGVWSYTLTTENLSTIGQDVDKIITAEQTRTVNGTDYKGTTTATVAVDTLAPSTLTIADIATDNAINAAEKAAANGVQVTGSAEAGAKVLLTLGETTKVLTAANDGVWSYTLTNADYKALGASTSVSAVAIDAAGNKSDAVTQTITIDTTAPTLGLVKLTSESDSGFASNPASFLDGRTNVKNPTIQFIAEAGADLFLDTGSGYVKQVDKGTNANQILMVGEDLAEGVHTIKLKAVDAAGNESIRTTSIVIDSTAPTISDATPSTPENSGANKVVYKATSTDASVVGYALKQGQEDDAGSFDINARTGDVTLKVNPDYEAKDSYSFTIVATDAAGNASEKAVTLSVTDVNEAPTVVTLANTTTIIAENTVISSARKIADIAITDDAMGSNSVTLSGADAASFELGDDGGLYLKANTALNFEAKNKLDVTVNVADNSLPGSTPVTANYTLTITDVNEAPTAVTLTNKAVNLAENTAITTAMKVADIVISDDALGSETISLTGADAAKFEVMNGALYLKAGTSLDYEAQNKLDVTVEVKDETLVDSTPVTANYSLAVTNVNERPVASKNYQSTQSIVNGQTLTDATFVPDFVDPEGDNLSFTYSGTLPAGLTFTNGVVSGTPTTDGNYTFTVTASDGTLTHSQEYTVSVVSAPVVQSMTVTDATGNTTAGKQGDALTITLNLSEAVTLSAQAAPTITISGAQAPFNATFVSQSTDGKSLTFTAIAPAGNTNTLYLQSIELNGATIKGNTTGVDLVLSSNASATYALDNTPPADAVISVGGEDSVLNATEATSATPIMITPEAGAMVTSVRVNDVSLTASNNAYTFDATQLSQGQHSITVVTQDAAGNTKTTVKTFTIDTTAPSLTSSGTAEAIAENSGANQIIYKAASDDASAKYSLKATADHSLLSIDANSGEVKLLANPNYEVKSSYSFTVVATDAVGNVSEQAVVLNITNVNDAPTGSVSISGSPVVGQTLTVNNTIVDEDGKGAVSYQWFADNEAIQGATSTSFSLTDSHVGKAISVTASYTDGLGKVETLSTNAFTVSNLPPLFGDLQPAADGGYQTSWQTKFVKEDGTAWIPAEGETVVGLTMHSVANNYYYDIVIKAEGGYSYYSFIANPLHSDRHILSSTEPTVLGEVQLLQLALNWRTDLTGNGQPTLAENHLAISPAGEALYQVNNANGAFAIATMQSAGFAARILQNADGSLWQLAQGAEPKALAYNPINNTMNFYYVEAGSAKLIAFSMRDGLATAGTVEIMGNKGIAITESFTGIDLDGDGVEVATVQAKWIAQGQSTSSSAIYLVKATDSEGKAIFGLVVDNTYDDITLTQGNPLSYFMKLFKTNDGANAWTPGSDDLSVKSAIYNSTTKQYEVLLQSTSTKAFSMWTFGTNGNATTTTAEAVSAGKLYAFEQAANEDLNGDGIIGTTYLVDITSGMLTTTLNSVPNFTISSDWKLDSQANLSFTSSTAGAVTFPDGEGEISTIPFTLTNGIIVFDLGDGSTASYKLLANSTNMMVIADTDINNKLVSLMNQDQYGPAPIMTIYKDTLTSAQALPTQSITLYTSKTENFGDWQNPVSLMLDPTTNKVSFTDIWGVTKTTNFTVSNNVINIDMNSLYGNTNSGSVNSMKVSVLGSTNGYYLIQSEKTSGYQQGSTTLTDIREWFASPTNTGGMNNTYSVYGENGPISVNIAWNNSNTATFTADGKNYTATYDATSNSIKFQYSPDYYEQYTLSNGVVMHIWTDFSLETWSTLPGFDYDFTPNTPPVITFDVDSKTATISNIDANREWQYQINNRDWITGTQSEVGTTGVTINLDSYISLNNGYVYVNVKQADANGDFNGNSSEYAYQSAYFAPSAPTIASTLDNVTNLDIRSNLVLTASEPVYAISGKYIRIINDANTTEKAGLYGEAVTNSFSIAANDARVSINGNKITINLDRDLDFANNYHIEVDAGAFIGLSSNLGNMAISDATSINFATVTPGTDKLLSSTQGQAQMVQADGTLANSLVWKDIEGWPAGKTGSQATLDMTQGSFGLLTADQMADLSVFIEGSAATNVETGNFNLALQGFGNDDLIYMDDLGRNNENGTQTSEVIFAIQGTSNGTDSNLNFDPALNKDGGNLDVLAQSFATLQEWQAQLQATNAPFIYG